MDSCTSLNSMPRVAYGPVPSAAWTCGMVPAGATTTRATAWPGTTATSTVSPRNLTAPSGSEPAGDYLNSSPIRLLPELPIQVVFTKLVVGGKDVSGQNNPSFSIYANSLIARYSALNVSNDHRILFRYRLKGANSAWTETTQRELQLAELAPGAYRLDVEAQ